MAAIINRKKIRLDKNGNPQRVKYKGSVPLSIGYGVYLGDSYDDSLDSHKVYFLMSGIASDGSTVHGQQVLCQPMWAGVSLDDFPFSKKFTSCSEIADSLKQGIQYWFVYTSEATTSTIDGKSVTYETLDLKAVDDAPGFDGLKGLLNLFEIAKSIPST